jgi:non-ribosomal peptide synthetase component F
MRSERTTLVLDGALLRRAKALAAQRGTTLSAVVSDALQQALSAPRPQATAPFKVVVFGSKRKAVDHSPADLAGYEEAEDLQRLGR